MAKQRIIERIEARQSATILLNGGKTVVPCVIRDFNGDGVGLDVPKDSILPDAFDLHLPSSQATCRVHLRWRSKDRVGVAF
jgi:hypothetical protein